MSDFESTLPCGCTHLVALHGHGAQCKFGGGRPSRQHIDVILTRSPQQASESDMRLLQDEVLLQRVEAQGHAHWAMNMAVRLDELRAELGRVREHGAKSEQRLREQAQLFARAHELAELRVVELRAELLSATRALEIERMRLAACGVAAHGGSCGQILPEYRSDVLQAIEGLRERLEKYQTVVNADEKP